MSTATTPVFVESTPIAAQRIAFGANPTVRATLDLTAKPGAFIYPRIGRNNTTALGAACNFSARRVIGGSAGTRINPGGNNVRASSIAAAGASTAVATTNVAIGDTVINVTSGTGFAAGDVIKIEDGSGGTFTRLEFARVSKVVTNALYLDAPVQFAHTTAQADTVVNGADVFAPIWLPGGSLWELIFDFGAAGSGGPLTVECVADVYTNDVSA